MVTTPVPWPLDIHTSPGPRSAGLHVSDLYNAFYRKYQPERYHEIEPGEQPSSVLPLGLAWEQYLERCFLAQGVKAERPGEFQTAEGVYFSPDLIINGRPPRGGEIKFTTMGEQDFSAAKFAKWHTQAKVYGHHLQLPDWTFFICFARGDYRKNIWPIYREIQVAYTAKEMRDEWALLLSFGRQNRMLI